MEIKQKSSDNLIYVNYVIHNVTKGRLGILAQQIEKVEENV